MRKPLVEDKYIGNPSQGMGAPPARFSREAAPGDPWDASNEPDAFSPLEMIQPDAEDVSAEDNAMLDEWLGQRAARPGTVDASHIAPLRGRVVDGSSIGPRGSGGAGYDPEALGRTGPLDAAMVPDDLAREGIQLETDPWEYAETIGDRYAYGADKWPRPGTVDASRIAPLRERVVDGSKIAPMREPGEPGEAPHPAAAEASEGFEGSLDPRSLDYIPAFADNLVAEARAKQRGRR